MRMDPELLREIVLRLEDEDGPIGADAFVRAGRGRRLVGYHFKLLEDAGLANASFLDADNDPYYHATVNRLTFSGQEFARDVRPDHIWVSLMGRVSEIGGSVSVGVLTSLATAVVRSALGI